MGFFSTIFGFTGFGIGISIGLVAGYFLFIYFQPSDVQVPSSPSQIYLCIMYIPLRIQIALYVLARGRACLYTYINLELDSQLFLSSFWLPRKKQKERE